MRQADKIQYENQRSDVSGRENCNAELDIRHAMAPSFDVYTGFMDINSEPAGKQRSIALEHALEVTTPECSGISVEIVAELFVSY